MWGGGGGGLEWRVGGRRRRKSVKRALPDGKTINCHTRNRIRWENCKENEIGKEQWCWG